MRFYRLLLFCLTLLGCGWLGAQATARPPELRVEVSTTANRILKQAGYSLDHGSTARTSYVLGDAALLRLLDRHGFDYAYERLPERRVATVGRRASSGARTASECWVPLDAYPTYDLYEELLEGFAADFPDLVRLHELGTLSSGRRILALEITDQPDLEEVEPKVLLTSSMHGDELGGYHVTLRLIAHLLCEYEQDDAITELINETELWINPLANPDGAYRNDNATIENPSRGNANFVDLNRNFPDPDDGDHPDGLEYQEETLIFMQFAEDYTFDLSMNIHGGAEVFNYPWDTYAERTADDAWWIHIARQYADGCQHHANHNGYMDALDDGITNGYDWYPIYGGRQDYVNYFHRGREATLEISNVKTTPPEQFQDIWDYNRQPLLDFVAQSRNGLSGTVTDSLTGLPVLAEVTIPGHDELNSSVFSKMPTGRYHRYLKAGVYTLTFHAEGYHPKTVIYPVADDQPNELMVELVPLLPSRVNVLAGSESISVQYRSGTLFLDRLPREHDNWEVQLYNLSGQLLRRASIPANLPNFRLTIGELPQGVYVCRLTEGRRQRSVRFRALARKRR